MVRIASGVATRVDVDGRVGETRNMMAKLMVDRFCDVVGVRNRKIAIDRDVELRTQFVANPADANVLDRLDPGNPGGLLLRSANQGGINRIHEAPIDVASRVPEDEQDGDGDGEADDRIGQLPAHENTECADDDCQRREAIGARVEPVGDERGGTDLATDTDAVDGDEFVSRESNQASSSDPSDVAHRMWMHQAIDGYPRGDG